MAEPSKTLLGKYELLEVIGDGAEGRVYKASCASDSVPGVARGELVAVKRLKSTGHEKESQQFLRQIKILSKLNHPNIVRHKDSFVWREKELEEDIYCLVMELLDGEPLKTLIEKNRGGLPWELAGGILSQTLQALQYASKNGVIHRDLKPSNIYITTKSIPKLVDFGIARQDDGESTATSSAAGAKGTFDYMAPDFALQHGGFRGDEQSDIFSFGIILYYTLAGRLPFPALGEQADRGYYIRWLGQQPPNAEFRHPVFRVLSHARTCIARCIDPDRQARFKTFDEVMADFAQIGYRKLKHGNEVYEFTDWLGKGGFGEVFRARRVSDRRDVAIKRLFSTGQSARFVREAKILRAAAHPNLTEYVDFIEVRVREDEKEYYLILEYLEGMPDAGLRDRIKNSENGLDPTEALQLFVRYLDCLEHLHKNGIIHRDIKPGNLYAPAGNPKKAKIFDLGIAHDEEGTRTHGQVPGTLDFMPPEFATQTSGRGSAQSDIYSIGVTLYQSLTKKLPFPRLPEKDAEAWVAFFRRSEKPLDCPFDHPVFKSFPELAALLRRALAHDSKHRFESAGAMRNEINNILQKWGAPAFDYEEEQPTIATAFVKPAAPAAAHEEIEDIEAEAAEAETRVADLPKIERELAQAAPPAPAVPEKPAAPPPPAVDPAELERQRLAAAEAEKKNREEAERLAQERERKAAEDAEKRNREEAERRAREKERQAAEEIRRKEREAAERVEQERRRIAAAEAAEKKRIEDERRAKIRAERAPIRRKQMAKLAKIGMIVAAVAALAAGGWFGWNKLQVQMRENAFTKAVSQAKDDFKTGDFTAAIAKANEALAIHKEDSPMQKLIADAQAQAKLHESYGGAIKNAQSAFDGHDYTNAVSWAAQALSKMPGDPAATKLQENAQRFLDDYHNAVTRANASYKDSDFAGAGAEADKALAIYPKDAAMQQLKSNVQMVIVNQTAYNDAMTKARAAFDSRDFTNTVTFANNALQKIPNEQNATRLRDSAQKYLNDFREAVDAASAAFKGGDFEGADTSADKALAIYKTDAAMLKLKTDAQAQIKLRAAYTSAFKNAQTAFSGGDYTNAVAWAAEALKQLAGDAKATTLHDDAQKLLNDYHAAFAAANAAAQKSDYATVVVEADKALVIYRNDTTMRQLKASAQSATANLQAYREAMASAQSALDKQDYNGVLSAAGTALQKIPNDAAAAKIRDTAQQALNSFGDTVKQAQAAYQQGDFAGAVALADKVLGIRKDDAAMQKLKADTLRQLDANLVVLLESFNVSVPSEIKYAEVKKTSTLGAIGDAGKPYYQAQVDKLEKAYRAGNWLGEGNRQTSIHDLRKAIDNWE
jgi:serine/threonine protein kinase